MNIPKIIHQIHLGSSPLSDLEKKWQLSWKKNNPEYIYILWDEQKIAQHIEITHTQAFYDCKNFLEAAEIIKSSKFFIVNSSFGFTIAEGLKVPRIMESYPDFPVIYPNGGLGYDFYFQKHFEKICKKLNENN